MNDEKIFVDGMGFKDPSDKAPDFVLGSLWIRPDDLIEWIGNNRDGDYINIKLLRSKNGKPYLELDTWKPNTEARPDATPKAAPVSDAEFEDDIPF